MLLQADGRHQATKIQSSRPSPEIAAGNKHEHIIVILNISLIREFYNSSIVFFFYKRQIHGT